MKKLIAIIILIGFCSAYCVPNTTGYTIDRKARTAFTIGILATVVVCIMSISLQRAAQREIDSLTSK